MKKEIIYLITTIIGGVMLLAATIFVIVSWAAIPDRIPVHFNFSGEADGYGGRGSLIAMLLVAWTSFALLTVIERFPNTWNIPVKVTAQNKAKLYSITRSILVTIKLLITFLFIVMFLNITTLVQLPPWIMTALVAVVLITVIINIIRMFRYR